jgi:hypothetical protein
LYTDLVEFGTAIKLMRLIKMCLNEACGRVRVCQRVSDMLHVKNVLKQGDALLPLLFSFLLHHAIRRVQVNRDGLKLNGTHQLWFVLMVLMYWVEGYILWRKTCKLW